MIDQPEIKKLDYNMLHNIVSPIADGTVAENDAVNTKVDA